MKNDRRKTLVGEVRKAAAILGHTPSSAEFDELHKRGLVAMPHSSFSKEFKTWSDAIVAAGLEIRRFRTRNKYYSNEELLSILKEFIDREGYLPTQNDFIMYDELPSWFTYYNRFGSMKKAFALLGYDYDRERPKLDEAGMIKALQELKKRLGRIPNAKDLGQKNGVPCRRSFERIFGSWSAALKAAGLERIAKRKEAKRNSEERYSEQRMLADYLKLAERLGHEPSTEEIGKKNGTPCYRTYVKKFGSWEKFKSIVENV